MRSGRPRPFLSAPHYLANRPYRDFAPLNCRVLGCTLEFPFGRNRFVARFSF